MEQTADARRLAELLRRAVAGPGHARLLNTLARLEYVGVRKMLKSRRAEGLDLDDLQHVVDEAAHALRLKRAAVAAAEAQGTPAGVRTFADQDTLAGAEAEAYFQAVDRAAEEAVADLPEAARGQANYLLTSAAIEVRALAFYPAYGAALREAGARASVESIVRDEQRHLDEMAASLERLVPGWRARLEPVLAREQDLFGRFLDALERAVADGRGFTPTRQGTAADGPGPM